MGDTGRYFVVTKDGRKFCVEPMEGGDKTKWGDVNPSTGKIEGSYGEKNKGCVSENESIITEENGYTNIAYLKPGDSPDMYIREITK